ncbi:MAG: hypothetical protein QOH25_2266 [Acidobacteriota bacterium]|jgi:hypothetical protein|nr:hypothetical protein [Acidobacteriota bacterium]
MLHLVIWSGVFAFWLFVTRQHHPTWLVAASATAALVSAFALAVYVNSLWLWPKFAKRRRWWLYIAALLMTVAVIDLVTVLLIQFIYDWLWGTDAGRYSFWFNMASDGAGIIVHVVAAMGVLWIARSLRRSRPPQPIAG